VAVVAMTALIIWIFAGEDIVGRQDSTATHSQDTESEYDHTEGSSYAEQNTSDNAHGINQEEAAQMREYYIDCIMLPEGWYKDGVYDIRIRFPDGEDYVVVAGKTVESAGETGIRVMLTPDELYSLSSARTDSEVYVGTEIYLTGYASDKYVVSQVDYPANMYVSALYTGDEQKQQECHARRIQLEENLAVFMNQIFEK